MKVQIVNKSKYPTPQYTTPLSAGLDVRGDFSLFKGEYLVGYPIGEGCAVTEVDEDNKPLKILIPAHARVMVPTGLYIALPEGYEMQVRPRSGLAAKHGITVLNSPGTIDADYRGECKTILINNSTEPFELECGERMCQWVCAVVPQVEWEEVDVLDETERGTGGFGHSGRK